MTSPRRPMRLRCFAPLLVAVVAFFAAAASAAEPPPPRFRVTDLGAAHGVPAATALDRNGGGQVIGYWFDGANAPHTYLTRGPGPIDPAVHDLGNLPGGIAPQPAAVNDAGAAVVMGDTPGANDLYGRRSYYLAPGRSARDAVPIPTLGGEFGITEGMNNNGMVVGWSRLAPDLNVPWHAWAWTPGSGTRDLGTLYGGFSSALDVNDAGQVVGWSSADGRSSRAYRTAPGAAIRPEDDLGTFGGGYVSAMVINNAGQVAGYSASSISGGSHLFRTAPNVPINPATDDLGLLDGADLMEPNDMNERGDIVGQALLNGGGSGFHAFLAVGTTIYDLNDLVEPGSGIVLSEAWAINEAGNEILVTGGDQNTGRNRAVLLTLVPEPGAALGALVVGVLLCHRPRRQG